MMFKILPCVVGGCLPYSCNMGNILNINSVKISQNTGRAAAIALTLQPSCCCHRHNRAELAPQRFRHCRPCRKQATATATVLLLQPSCCCCHHHHAELAPQRFRHCRCCRRQATATATTLPPLPLCCCHHQTSTLDCAQIFI